MARNPAVVHCANPERRFALKLALAALIGAWERSALADDMKVPAPLQAQFLSKVAAYDRGFRKRVGERVHVLILTNQRSLQSRRVAGFLKTALSQLPNIGGVQHDVDERSFDTASNLVAACRAQGVAVLYLTSGLDDWIEPIRSALESMPILTVAADPEYVSRGIILGFDLVAGRPKILIHLGQAQKQGIDFSSELLKLAKVFR